MLQSLELRSEPPEGAPAEPLPLAVAPHCHEDIRDAGILMADDDPRMIVMVKAYQQRDGYPVGLAGEEIPIEGRIVAVADVIDAFFRRRAEVIRIQIDCADVD